MLTSLPSSLHSFIHSSIHPFSLISTIFFFFFFFNLSCHKLLSHMGNCQAVDAAVLVIQHPCGKIERLYWPVTASEVMRTNPGHYVSLIIPLPVPPQDQNQDQKTVRFTRVKLLRPNETLNLGHAYRLITTQGIYIYIYMMLSDLCDEGSVSVFVLCGFITSCDSKNFFCFWF